MSDYRACIVGSDGQFKSFEAIIAPDDEQAVKAARQFVDGFDVEVWQSDRKITMLRAKDSTSTE